MKLIKFVYSEPRIGEFEYEGPDMSEEAVLEAIQNEFPEAEDIELIG